MKQAPLIIMIIAFIVVCIISWSPKGYVPILTNTATLNFGNTAAGASTDLTITVTGATVGDAVLIGIDPASVPSTGIFYGWVSATNTATIRFANNDVLSSVDPPSGTFRATIIKQ